MFCKPLYSFRLHFTSGLRKLNTFRFIPATFVSAAFSPSAASVRLSCWSPPAAGLSYFLQFTHVPAVVSLRSVVLRSFLTHHSLAAFNHFVTPRKSNGLNLLHLASNFVIPQSGSIQPSISIDLLYPSYVIKSIFEDHLNCSRYCFIPCSTQRSVSFHPSPLLLPALKQKFRQPLAVNSSHPSPSFFGLLVCHRWLHSQSARTSFLRFGCNPFVPHSLHPTPQRLLKAV